MDGLLLVDKPAGWTSHDVVARTRRLAGQKRIGHTGTLDPMATGLLVLCIGRATRLVEYMSAHDKAYEGEIALGLATTTDDAEGDVIATAPVPALTEEAIEELEERFTGWLAQVPPRFSAIKRGGVRAYAVARAGEDPDLAARTVLVRSLALRHAGADRLRITVHCGPGTYIRSIARDIGAVLGCGAHLASLRRLGVGRFSVDDAWSIEELEGLASAGQLEAALLAPDEGIAGTGVALLAAGSAARLIVGQAVPVAAAKEDGPLRVYDSAGSFIAIARLRQDELAPVKVFADSDTFDRGLAGGMMPVGR